MSGSEIHCLYPDWFTSQSSQYIKIDLDLLMVSLMLSGVDSSVMVLSSFYFVVKFILIFDQLTECTRLRSNQRALPR